MPLSVGTSMPSLLCFSIDSSKYEKSSSLFWELVVIVLSLRSNLLLQYVKLYGLKSSLKIRLLYPFQK